MAKFQKCKKDIRCNNFFLSPKLFEAYLFNHIHFEVLIYEHDHIGIPCVHKCSFSFVLTTFLQEFEALIDKQLEKQAIRQVEEEDSQIYKQRVNKARKQIELELNVLETTGELHGID